MPDNPTEITARWKGGLSFEAVNAQGVTVRMDPSSAAPFLTPMETLLMALAGCTGMDVASILGKKRQQVESIEIRVRGAQAEEHPKVYTMIDMEFVLSGADLSSEAAERAIALSTEKYCSVGAMLAPSARIRTSFRILAGHAGSA
ncbi:MAG: OsmC family protein [Anaerolineales bacterium]|nr:OsmC family protein [Anaerolineales bacterium]